MKARLIVAAVVLGLAAASNVPRGAATSAGTLALRGTLNLVSIRNAPCPPGTRPGLLCPARTATGLVPGLGSVTESYSYIVEESPASCPGGAKVFGYPVRWVVQGKGEIEFAVHELAECESTQAFTADQSFTITGGTGIYAGASGSGTVDRALTQTAQGARGPERWTGTLTVAGLDFDLTPPTISGATAKTVRARKGQKRVRVRYAVTARDDVDGTVAVSCRPASGSRFKVGRTTVRCSAADRSANTATATFVVAVKRA